MMSIAFDRSADKVILARCKTEKEAFEYVRKMHDPETHAARQMLFEQFHKFPIPPRNNPTEALWSNWPTACVTGTTDKPGIGCLHFFLNLRGEHTLAHLSMQRAATLNCSELVRVVSTHYTSTGKGKAWKSDRNVEIAFFAGESSGGAERPGRNRSRNGGGVKVKRGGGSRSATFPAISMGNPSRAWPFVG